MPNILLLCEYATLNGGERSMLATLGGVQQAGFRVTVVAPPQGPLPATLRARDVRVLPFRTIGEDGTRRSQEQLRRKLRGIIERCGPDLVHANSLSMGRLSGPVSAELGVPSIAHLRDILRLTRAAIADLNRHTRLLAVSMATRDYHVAAGLDAKKTHVLHNGVDLRRFRPRRPTGYLHGELSLPADAQLIGAVGQIGMRKGLDVFVQAAALVAAKRPRSHFLIVGARFSEKEEARRHEADLRRAAAVGVLAGRCRFVGVRDDVDRLMGELELLVHAARQEPLGRVLLEAAAAGVPVVATDVGGTREIFPPPLQAAILVPPGDAAATATAIVDLLDAPARRRQLGQAARHRAEEAFDAEAAGRWLAAHYRQVLMAADAAGRVSGRRG